MHKLLFISFLFFFSPLFCQTQELVAYFPQWGVEHKPYYIKHIESAGSADKITVINYAFIIPTPDSSGKIFPQFMNAYYDYGQSYSAENSIDGKPDDPNQPLRGHFNQLKKLKERHPHIKIVPSFGGWTGSIHFSDAARTKESREYFVDKCIEIFIEGNLPQCNGAGGKGVAKGIFDGFDIDWEFPGEGGIEGIHHDVNDAENLTKLFALFRERLDEIDPDYLLTAAVPGQNERAKFFNIKNDAQYLDWYLLMTYDYRGSWSNRTGHHTNLFTSPKDLSEDGIHNSFDNTIRLFRDIYGVPSSKIIPGAAFYGRGWKDVTRSENGQLLYQSGRVANGNFENGFNNYKDLIQLVDKGYTFYWDNDAMAPYIYSENEKIFWTFDNKKSIALKAQYADAFNLRGMMFWEITGDDKSGSLVQALDSRNIPYILQRNKREELFSKIGDLVSPKQKEQFKTGDNIIIMPGEINLSNFKKLEYYVDGKIIGYEPNGPFCWVWFNVSAGKHIIQTKIFLTNKILVSEPIEIVVKD